ncbi:MULTISPECIES: nickel pincer cofactor biosynthesis protein LarB [unclassified Butyrivibrio]|uniref:nickel pincer cofactor biosynthesis protein LarB n=1 Tax=unclassified Butyrivibrio TaxID=2639466 RepID=UPI0003B40548|nr:MULTISPECIES: nickel pincer cofactor biosynthesis protein LarB [unclassified Butyrivibrio]MDC7294662.1 nickel pincer cofactor biosynthesis protein LarB [Butyrivibrio sp. DSM 10294]
MEQKEIRALLEGIKNNEISVEDVLLKLKEEPFEDLGYARPDHHRGLRQGRAEVIFGQGKTREQILGISENLISHGQKSVLITRMSKEAAGYFKENLPASISDFTYDELSRVGIAGQQIDAIPKEGKIVIATGGTSDIPVAEEAARTAEIMGNNVVRLYDVGVAGIHRLFDKRAMEEIMTARVIVAIAGMEGALASVIGGLADCPVIAVPTSVGYGASFGGLSALLSMLNSCASGVSVVNIDNGFGAGYLAGMINQK